MNSEWVRVAHGSFGSRGGEPWSQKIAQANGRTAPTDTAAGVFGAVVAPSQDAMRAAIESQTCPWCGAGPYKMLASHTNKSHGVDKKELREMAGYTARVSICSPERAEDARRSLVNREDWEETRKRANERSVQAGSSKLASAARVQKLQEDNKERYASIVAAIKAGRGRHEVAKMHGVAPATVARVLRANGIAEDGRIRAAQLRPVDLEKMRQAAEQSRKRARQERIDRFRELGADWDAMCTMADEQRRTKRSMAAILRHDGLEVPDGRVKDATPCAEHGCDSPTKSRGLCSKHYQRIKNLEKKKDRGSK